MSKGFRSWQGSNLRGQSPLDFKSNALTTRPQLLYYKTWVKTGWRCRGSNPGPFTCKANALPLSYIPIWPENNYLLFLICTGYQTSLSRNVGLRQVVFKFVGQPDSLIFSRKNCQIIFVGLRFVAQSPVYGHIMLKTPVLVWSLKLSNIEPC